MDFDPDEAIAAGWLRADSFVGRVLEQSRQFVCGRTSIGDQPNRDQNTPRKRERSDSVFYASLMPEPRLGKGPHVAAAFDFLRKT
jgi:hypothetical protein